jgi:transcriptional regulator with GAF, ATPase, and Fis domain
VASNSCFRSTYPAEDRVIVQSPALCRLEEEIDRAAHADAGVLITGEPGVGKELAARCIHQRSRRAAAAFCVVHCAGMPDILLESELFGHRGGSFRGAYKDKPGLLELALNGTVLLCDIDEVGSRVQEALRRFMAEGCFSRIGEGRADRRADVRLIAATRRDLQPQVATGAFRDDLYARLTVNRLSIPPLREHPEDIPRLVVEFLHSYCQMYGAAELEVSTEAMRALSAYGWPGNVRELENVVERAVLQTLIGLSSSALSSRGG